MTVFPHANLTHAIIGAFFRVFNELGHGYSEKLYRRAVAIVLRELGHAATEERLIDVHFHGVLIGTYRADLVVDERILIEIKAAKELEPRDEAQLLNYLKSAGGGVGFLVNFGRELKHKRMVMGNPESNLPNLRQPEACPDRIE